MCKVTLDDIKKLNSVYALPKEIHCNKGVLFDYRLFQALCEPDAERDHVYDFDCYLEKYGCNLQRDYVWKRPQQREFITSILLDKPIESVIVIYHENERNRFANKVKVSVIDGKQRLMTIRKFANNEFTIVVNGKEVRYSDFDEDTKRFFKTRVNYLTATVYYSYPETPVTDEMKIKLFNYYNFAGTPQTEEHKNKLQSLLEK